MLHKNAMKSEKVANDNRLIILIVTSVCAFLTPFSSSAINIALPAIGKEFTASAVILGWIATSFLLATAVFLVPFGRLADIHGMKKMMVSGLMLYTLSSTIAATSIATAMLLAARVMQGVAGAMILSTSTALLVMAYPPERRGQVLGINVACVYTGLSLGPFLGGVITQTMGWRTIFWVITGVSLVAVTLTLSMVKNEWAIARGQKFDLIGAVIYGIGLIALIWGLSQLPYFTGFISIIAGILTLAGFIFRELNISSPVLNINLFIKNRVFGLSSLAALINYAGTFAVTFLLSLYLQYIKALTPANAGMVILIMPVLQAIFSPFTGRFSDIIEPRLLASSGMALTVVGLLMLVFIDNNTSMVYIISSLAILGFGFALFSSPNTNAVMSSAGKGSMAIASATLATMRLIGQMLSMGIAMLMLAIIMGNLQILPEFYPQFQTSVRYCFAIFTLLCFGGIFASMARGKIH